MIPVLLFQSAGIRFLSRDRRRRITILIINEYPDIINGFFEVLSVIFRGIFKNEKDPEASGSYSGGEEGIRTLGTSLYT